MELSLPNVLFSPQSGRRPPADGDYVAADAHRHEGSAVMAVPDEGHHSDPLLEHHHGQSTIHSNDMGVNLVILLTF